MTEATTGRAAMLMQESYADRQMEMRARNIAMSVAKAAHDKYFHIDDLEDARDVSRAIMRAAETAAYNAVMREREAQAHDIEMVKRVIDSQLKIGSMVAPQTIYVMPKPE